MSAMCQERTCCAPLCFRKPSGEPSVRQGYEHSWLDSNRGGKTINRECGIERQHFPRFASRFLVTSKAHQRRCQEQVANTGAWVLLRVKSTGFTAGTLLPVHPR